jgi:hypothetical protein
MVKNSSTNTLFYMFQHLMSPDKIKDSAETPYRIQQVTSEMKSR